MSLTDVYTLLTLEDEGADSHSENRNFFDDRIQFLNRHTFWLLRESRGNCTRRKSLFSDIEEKADRKRRIVSGVTGIKLISVLEERVKF